MVDLRTCSIDTVAEMCARYHGYGSAGCTATYAFAVFEQERPVAAFAWQPPPPGSAKNTCVEAPYAVLALSRMVAVPKSERVLNHISKPLRMQMRRLIDRTRWPVLITFSDEGQGHTGHVYKCSGWRPTLRTRAVTFSDSSGARVSRYSNGKTQVPDGAVRGFTFIQRWEHWVCDRSTVATWLPEHGWVRQPTSRVWKSGNPAFRWERAS